MFLSFLANLIIQHIGQKITIFQMVALWVYLQAQGFTGDKTLTLSSLMGGGGDTTAGSCTMIALNTNIAIFFDQPWQHYFIVMCALYKCPIKHSNCIHTCYF